MVVIAHISQLELSNLEDSGRAQVTLEPAQDGVVSHALVFEAEVTELRQALTEQHNRMAGRIAELQRYIDIPAPVRAEAHGELDSDGWTPAVFPDQNYFMQCCDCGLVHEIEFAAIKTEPADGGFTSEELPWPEHRVRFKVRRGVLPATTLARAHLPAADTWVLNTLLKDANVMSEENGVVSFLVPYRHVPVDLDAVCLSLLTDDQAVMTLDRIKESRRLSYVAAIYSGIPE